MDRQYIQEWCQQNNWTEPRLLNNETWVAFPPGGVIETPLPMEAELATEPRVNYLLNIVDGLVLITATIIVGVIALIISPLFLERW